MSSFISSGTFLDLGLALGKFALAGVDRFFLLEQRLVLFLEAVFALIEPAFLLAHFGTGQFRLAAERFALMLEIVPGTQLGFLAGLLGVPAGLVGFLAKLVGLLASLFGFFTSLLGPFAGQVGVAVNVFGLGLGSTEDEIGFVANPLEACAVEQARNSITPGHSEGESGQAYEKGV